MAANLEYICECSEDGEITIRNKRGFVLDVNTFFKGKLFKMRLFAYRKTRSLEQNGLMHVYFTEIALETGLTMQKVKDMMKKEFLTVDVENGYGEKVINPVTGQVMTRVMDTSELNTLEAFEFCEKVKLFVQDFGIYLKNSNEQNELKFD